MKLSVSKIIAAVGFILQVLLFVVLSLCSVSVPVDAYALLQTHAYVTNNYFHTCYKTSTALQAHQVEDGHNRHVVASSRRVFVSTALLSTIGLCRPHLANAGIDVSGLSVQQGGNPSLAEQLKAYDGSASTRIQQAKALQQTSTPSSSVIVPTTTPVVDDRAPIATWAYRSNPGFNPTITKVGVVGTLSRLSDVVEAPSISKRRSIQIQFEFPSDWLQLDRNNGGIQYVDQRNGDKLYVFRAPLPPDTTLATMPKALIGQYIFDSNGSLAKSGQTIEDYKVSSSQIVTECPNQECATRRRFKIKYATVTGNGLRVERRALVDAYQVENDIYMLMTSSNAVKFDKEDSLERETVEKIVNSFRIDF